MSLSKDIILESTRHVDRSGDISSVHCLLFKKGSLFPKHNVFASEARQSPDGK